MKIKVSETRFPMAVYIVDNLSMKQLLAEEIKSSWAG